MIYEGFKAEIEYDDKTEMFYGAVTNLGDVITFQGRTFIDMIEAFRDSVEGYLEFRDELGMKPIKYL